MLDKLRTLDKKFLIICGVIVLAPILILVILMLFRGCSGKTSFAGYEKRMMTAAKKYLTANDMLPSEEGEVVEVGLDTLISEGYIKDTGKSLNDSSCSGYVGVTNNGASLKINKGGYVMYIPHLSCKEYETTHIIDKLTENVVKEGSGLYETNTGYVFRGNKVDNYVTMSGKNYRIISIDDMGNLRLVRTDRENTNALWDNKYNTETNQNTGKNIYSDSKLSDILLSVYNKNKKFSAEARSHIVAHSVCVGKRSQEDLSFDLVECNEVLENQIVGLMTVSDFANASIDPECINIKSRSCGNYNYMRDFLDETWTTVPVSENSYQVYYLSNGNVYATNANDYKYYYIVVYVSGEELYTKGDGTQENPYVIGNKNK